jgi:hypothetical protein
MSHVKNVEAFGKLVGICTGLGENYNPGQQNLRIESITTQFANARAVLETVQHARKDFANATNKREVEFEKMRKLASRIVNDLRSSGVLEQTVADANSMYRKLVGYRVSRDPVKTADTPVEAKGRRARGIDYVTQVESFSILIKLVATQPEYNPGIAELKVAALEEMLTSLKQHNAHTTDVKQKLDKARWERNALLYNLKGSMAETLRAVKFQLRAILGARSEAYKHASRILLDMSF